jgi:hypothetical protein
MKIILYYRLHGKKYKKNTGTEKRSTEHSVSDNISFKTETIQFQYY